MSTYTPNPTLPELTIQPLALSHFSTLDASTGMVSNLFLRKLRNASASSPSARTSSHPFLREYSHFTRRPAVSSLRNRRRGPNPLRAACSGIFSARLAETQPVDKNDSSLRTKEVLKGQTLAVEQNPQGPE